MRVVSAREGPGADLQAALCSDRIICRVPCPWTRHRLDAALDHARTHPDTGGALVLRHVPPEAYSVTPRLDVVASHQVDALSPRHLRRTCFYKWQRRYQEEGLEGSKDPGLGAIKLRQMHI